MSESVTKGKDFVERTRSKEKLGDMITTHCSKKYNGRKVSLDYKPYWFFHVIDFRDPIKFWSEEFFSTNTKCSPL